MSTKTTKGFHTHSIDVDTRAWQEKTAMLMYLQKKEVGYITTERFLGASFSSHSSGFWEAQNVNLNSSAKHQFMGQRQSAEVGASVSQEVGFSVEPEQSLLRLASSVALATALRSSRSSSSSWNVLLW